MPLSLIGGGLSITPSLGVATATSLSATSFIQSGSEFRFTNATRIAAPGDGRLRFSTWDGTARSQLDFATTDVVKVRNSTNGAYAALEALNLALNGATIGANALAVTGGVDFAGNLNVSGFISGGASNPIGFFGRAQIHSAADGSLRFTNNANSLGIQWSFGTTDGVVAIQNRQGTDFSRLQFGGATSAFPALKRNSAAIDIRVADDSAYAGLNAGTTTVGSLVAGNTGGSGNVYAAGGAFLGLNGRSVFSSSSDGVMMVSNAAGTDFTRLQFGGTTSAFPALRRNGAAFDFVNADDTAFATIRSANLTMGSAAGAATGIISSFETTAPSAPAADGWKMYAVDNAGKTQLVVLFSSGAAQVVATQP